MPVKCQYKFLTRLIFLFSGSSCYLLTSERDEDNPFKQSNNFYFVFVNERFTVNDRIWKHCKHQARRLVSKIIKLCSASRTTFRAWFYRTDPQNIEGQFGTLSGFLRNTFRKRTSQKKPRNVFQTEKFQDYFLRNEHQFIPSRVRF